MVPSTLKSQPEFLVDTTGDTPPRLFIHKLTDEPYAGCECISTLARVPDTLTPLILIKQSHDNSVDAEEDNPAFLLILNREKQKIEIMTDHHSRVVLCYNKSGVYLRRRCTGHSDLAFSFPGHTFLTVLMDPEPYLTLEKHIQFDEIVPSLSQAMEMHFEPTDNLVLRFLEILKNVVYKQLDRHPEVRILASGGIDSTLLTYIYIGYISKKSTSRIELFNINFSEFAKDKVAFQALCESPRIKKLTESDPDHIKVNTVLISEEKFKNSLPRVRDLITPCPPTVMMLNLGSILYHATRQEDGSEIDIPVISGLGPDEYCGAYAALRNGDTRTWKESVKRACKNLFERNITRESGVFSQIIYPYLEPMVAAFFTYLMETERYELLRNKKILRDAALLVGVPPELSARPKQAAQFGTGCAKILKGEGYDTVCLSESITLDTKACS